MNNKKTVYFAGAIRGDRIMEHVFRDLIGFLKESGVTVLTEHLLDKHADAYHTAEYIERRDNCLA